MKLRSPNNNYDFILQSAMGLAEKIGRDKITFDLICKIIGMSRCIIYTHFKSIDQLKEAVLDQAIKDENIIIIIEALIFNHIVNDCLSDSIKNKIIEFLEDKHK